MLLIPKFFLCSRNTPSSPLIVFFFRIFICVFELKIMAEVADQVAELQAQVAELKVQNEALKPTLKTRVGITDLLSSPPEEFIGKVIGVAGWVRTARVQGKGGAMAFIKLFDGAGPKELQVVVDSDVENFAAATKGSTGASLWVIGKVVESQGREQAIELLAQSIEIIGDCPAETFPLAKAKLPLEYLRTVQHLRPRTATLASAFRIRNALSFAVHEFFQQRGYLNLHTPMITASDCEGAGEMFQVTTALKHGKIISSLKDKKDAAAALALKNAKAVSEAPPATEGEAAAPAEKVEEAKDERSDEELAQIVDYEKDFFGREAFLTVSGQLNGEVFATAMSKIYTFGPTFRAENSHTTRHLSEFWMIEPEIAFADLEELMGVAEAFIKHTINACLKNCDGDMALLEAFEKKQILLRAKERKEELKRKNQAEKKRNIEEGKKRKAEAQAKKAAFEAEVALALAEGRPAPEEVEEVKAPRPKKQPKKKAVPYVDWREGCPLRQRLQGIVDSEFARVTYTEAISIVRQAAADNKVEFEHLVEWGDDMGSEHERYLCERHFKRPTIVVDYPKSFKAFYMRANEDGKTVAAMDILVPGVGELIGGSQREERMPNLLAMMAEKELDPADFSWYLDLRRFGSVPHSGFGLGFERLVNYTTGLDNIRDVMPFPRFPGHAEC